MNPYTEYKNQYSEYQRLAAIRNNVISKNRSIRMSNIHNKTNRSLLIVPEKPIPPAIYECYNGNTYEGIVYDIDDVPEGMTFKVK